MHVHHRLKGKYTTAKRKREYQTARGGGRGGGGELIEEN